MAARTGSSHAFSSALRAWLALLLVLSFLPVIPASPASAAPSSAAGGQGVRIAQPSTLAVAANRTFEVRSDGTLWASGNAGASLGLGSGVNTAVAPTRVGEDADWVFVEADGSESFAIKADGTLWAWGTNYNYSLGFEDNDFRWDPTQVNADTDWVTVACSGGNGSTFALKADGSLWAWGYNGHGELGLGVPDHQVQTPARVGDANDWVHLAASQNQAAAIKADGTLYTWGQNTFGNLGLGYTSTAVATPTQVAGGDWASVSIGSGHMAAIKADGSLWAWGYNDFDILGVGEGAPNPVTSPMRVGDASDWVAVSAGPYFTLGIRADGSAWAWGENASGKLGIGTTDNATAPTRIGVDNDWVTVAAAAGSGGNRAFGMKANRSLYGWGANHSGNRLGVDSTAEEVLEPMLVGSAHGWTDVAEGLYHTLAVRSDGTLWAAGHNQYGRLGLGIENQWTSVPVYTKVGTDTDWVAVAASRNHSVALKDDGTLWAWGSNERGELGIGSLGAGEHSTVPVQVGTQTDWAQIAAAQDASYAVKDDGTLWCWGRNAYGQLGLGSWDSEITSPHMVESDVAWVAVDADTSYAMGVKADGTLWGWGHYSNGRLGIEGLSDYPRAPMQVGEDDKWVALSVGLEHSLALKADGTLWGWGANDSGELGLGNGSPQTLWTPTPLTAEGWSVDRWVEVSAGVHSSHAIAEDGTLWAWGDNSYYRLGDGTTDRRWEPVQIGGAAEWVALGSHERTSRGIRADGSIWAWGQDDYHYGQFGDGSVGQVYSPPKQVAGGANSAGRAPIAISAGREHTLALKGDGTLWAWGRNNHGQLGFGDNLDRDRPERVGADNDWVAIATGYASSYGLKADGTLWSWGWNEFGQLGLDDTADRDEPTLIDSAAKWVDIAAGDYHALAIAADGTLWAWGSGGNWQLGLGDPDDRSTPAQVASDLRWTAIAGGLGHTLALKSDGSLWSWGINGSNQLGHDDYMHRDEPEQVGADTEWTTVSAGSHSSYALQADGSMWSWGSHNHGRLGHTPENRAVPSEVPGHSDWVGVAGGGQHALGIKADGTAYATGDNEHGQLGLGDHTWARDSFTAIEIDAPLVSVAAAWANSFAVGADGTLWAWGDNTYGQLGLGDTEQRLSPEPVIALGDVIAPVILGVRSESHPVAGVGYGATTFVAELSAVDSGSGVAGYSWVVDTVADTVPDVLIDSRGSAASITAELTTDVTNYLHVRAVDAGGNASETVHRQILVADDVEPPPPVIEIAGDSRYETAVFASEEAYPAGLDAAGEKAVVIATGRNWPDALGGSALAGALDAPILLVNTNSVPAVVLPELTRLGAEKAYIVGGEAAVGTAVETALANAGLAIERVWGTNRYTTADAVALKTIEILDWPGGPGYSGTAFVATGATYADAVAAAPLAAAKGWPLYLAAPSGVRLATLAAMADVDDVLVLGGIGAVSADTYAQLEGEFDGAGQSVDRIWGTTRYGTAVAIATFGVEHAGLGWNRVGIATGQSYPDALAGGVLQGKMGSVMLLTRRTTLSPEPAAALAANQDAISTVTFFGGATAVGQTVRDSVTQILE